MNNETTSKPAEPLSPGQHLAAAEEALSGLDSYAPDERAYLGTALAAVAHALTGLLATDSVPAGVPHPDGIVPPDQPIPAWLAYAGVPLEAIPAGVREEVRSHRQQVGDQGMSIGVLREALVSFMDQQGAWGRNMHESKQVLVRLGGRVFPLTQVAASFYDGSFVVMLDAEDPEARS